MDHFNSWDIKPSVKYLYEKGKKLDSESRYEEAIFHYNQALNIESNNIDILISKGNALDDLGKHNDALNHYDKVLALDPDNYFAIINKIVTLNRIEEFHEIIRLCNKYMYRDGFRGDIRLEFWKRDFIIYSR